MFFKHTQQSFFNCGYMERTNGIATILYMHNGTLDCAGIVAIMQACNHV